MKILNLTLLGSFVEIFSSLSSSELGIFRHSDFSTAGRFDAVDHGVITV
jgi:hypothetical protein